MRGRRKRGPFRLALVVGRWCANCLLSAAYIFLWEDLRPLFAGVTSADVELFFEEHARQAMLGEGLREGPRCLREYSEAL